MGQYFRYKINKKQISSDKGITWVDTTPLETERGRLIGTYDSLASCECIVDEYRYEIVDVNVEDLPKLCTSVLRTFEIEEGIAKRISFSDYEFKGSTYEWSAPFYFYPDTELRNREKIQLGKWNDLSSCLTEYTLDGYASYFESVDECYCAPTAEWLCYGVDYCVTIEELMPWFNGSIKCIFVKHYIRENCNEEMYYDEEFGERFYAFAEKWEKIYDYENFRNKWEHKIATVDTNGIITWNDTQDEPQYTTLDIPHPEGAVGLEYISPNGYTYPAAIYTTTMSHAVNEVSVDFKLTNCVPKQKAIWFDYGDGGTYFGTGQKNGCLFGVEGLYNAVEVRDFSKLYKYTWIFNDKHMYLCGYGRRQDVTSQTTYIQMSGYTSPSTHIYSVTYIDHYDVTHKLLPMLYKQKECFVDITDRIVYFPVEDGIIYTREFPSEWYESF